MLPKMDFVPVNHIEIRNGQARIAGRNIKVKRVIQEAIDLFFEGEDRAAKELIQSIDTLKSRLHPQGD